ncbi:MAG TPA: peptidase [Candidatus Wirthbacteria bacterium]|nr:peptidase [Candidatus Wirthbacteria bacterium]
MTSQSKTVLFIVAPDDFQDEEYFIPRQILEEKGHQILTSSTLEQAVSKSGKTIDTDRLLGLINEAEADAIVFVGGSGCQKYFAMKKSHQIAAGYLEEGKIVGAICSAVSILANTGILQDVKVTGYKDEKKNILKQGGNYTGEEVEVDGLIITARDAEASQAFGEAIAQALEGDK